MKDGLPVSSSALFSRPIPTPLRQRFHETFANSFAFIHERPMAIVAAILLVALTALSLAEWLFTSVVHPHHIIAIVGAATYVGIANAIERERKDSEERTLPDDSSFPHPKNLPDRTSGNLVG